MKKNILIVILLALAVPSKASATTNQPEFNRFYNKLAHIAYVPIADAKAMWVWGVKKVKGEQVTKNEAISARKAFRRAKIGAGIVVVLASSILAYRQWQKWKMEKNEEQRKIDKKNLEEKKSKKNQELQDQKERVLESFEKAVKDNDIEKAKELAESPLFDSNARTSSNSTPLMMAIKSKDLDLVKLLIEKEADVNPALATTLKQIDRGENQHIYKPIDYSIAQGLNKRYIYTSGTFVQKPTIDDELNQIIKTLIENSNVNTDIDGFTLLEIAVTHNQFEAATELAKKGAKLEDEKLLVWLVNDFMPTIQSDDLIEEKLKFFKVYIPKLSKKEINATLGEKSAYFLATKYFDYFNQNNKVKELIDILESNQNLVKPITPKTTINTAPSKPTAPSQPSESPTINLKQLDQITLNKKLNEAINSNDKNYEFAYKLLEAGAKLSIEELLFYLDIRDVDPLQNNALKFYEKLLSNLSKDELLGRKFSNKYGVAHRTTPLTIVLRGISQGNSDYTKLLDYLLANKNLSINDQLYADKSTTLHTAVQSGLVSIVKKLIEKGADPRIKNNTNETAIDVAKKIKDTDKRNAILKALGVSSGGS